VADAARTVDGLGKLRSFHVPRPQWSGVVVMAAATALISWLVISDRNRAPSVAPVSPAAVSRSAPSPAPSPVRARARSLVIKPVALTASRLEAVAASLAQPVYWAGPLAGRRYELSRSRTGSVVVRYLPPGTRAGASGRFVAVGTFPFPDAYTTEEASTGQPGIRWRRLTDGGLATYQEKEPYIVYLAYRNLDYKIEVYDPFPNEARLLATSGRIRLAG
jgi:hypothetical protein